MPRTALAADETLRRAHTPTVSRLPAPTHLRNWKCRPRRGQHLRSRHRDGSPLPAQSPTDATNPDPENSSPAVPDRPARCTDLPRCSAQSRRPARWSCRSNPVAGRPCWPNPCACRNIRSRRRIGRACARSSQLRPNARRHSGPDRHSRPLRPRSLPPSGNAGSRLRQALPACPVVPDSYRRIPLQTLRCCCSLRILPLLRCH